MFYNSINNNRPNKCCFKMVYDVCITPSYYYKEDNTNTCNCRTSQNQENYYNCHSDHKKDDYLDKKDDNWFDRNEDNCNCKHHNRCCLFRNRCW